MESGGSPGGSNAVEANPVARRARLLIVVDQQQTSATISTRGRERELLYPVQAKQECANDAIITPDILPLASALEIAVIVAVLERHGFFLAKQRPYSEESGKAHEKRREHADDI
jgi:hypothetical protein